MDSNVDSNRVTTITCIVVMIQFDMSRIHNYYFYYMADSHNELPLC